MIQGLQPAKAFPRAQIAGYVALCLIWGSTWLAIRVLVRYVPPLEGAALRFVLAAVLLLGLAALQKRAWPNCRRQWNAVVVLSFTMMALPFGLIFWAEQYIFSSTTAVIYGASPLLAALFTPLMMHRSVPRRAIFAMVVALGGLLVLFWKGFENGRELMGGAAVLAAVLMSAWSSVYAKIRAHDIDAVVSTGLQSLFGAVVLLWGTWALEPRQHANWTLSAVLALVFLTLFGSCIAFVVYYWLLKRVQPYQAATISLVVPIVAVLDGSLLYGEKIPSAMIIAMFLVLASVGAVLRAERAGGSDHELMTLRNQAQ